MIADGDTGFGGTTSVMKLTKMMIESGAAGMHLGRAVQVDPIDPTFKEPGSKRL